MDKIEIGKFGEGCAADFLRSQDYCIIAQNYRCRFGEIDLIGVDYSNRELAFVEVKTRLSNLFGEPQDAVDFRKRSRLLKTALHFLSSATQKLPPRWRIDVIAVKLDQQYRLRNVSHFKNIFNG